MSEFHLNKVSNTPLTYQVLGIASFDGQISLQQGGWTLTYHATPENRLSKRYESLMLALSAVGMMTQSQFKSENREASRIVNTLIDNLRPYYQLTSKKIPGTDKDKPVRELREQLATANGALSLVLREDGDQIRKLCVRTREANEAQEKRFYISSQALLRKSLPELFEDAKKVFNTDKLPLTSIKPIPLLKDKAATALKKTKGQSAKVTDLFYDVALMGFLEKPVYCGSITDKVAIYDESTIKSLLNINKEYRETIQAIDNDRTDIKIILANPANDDLSELEQGLNPLFKAWLALLPEETAPDADEVLADDSEPLIDGGLMPPLQADIPQGEAGVQEAGEETAMTIPAELVQQLARQAAENGLPVRFLAAVLAALSQTGATPAISTQNSPSASLGTFAHALSHAVVEGLPESIKELKAQRSNSEVDNEEIESLLLSLTTVAVEEVKQYFIAMTFQEEEQDADWVKMANTLEQEGQLDALIHACLKLKYELDKAPFFKVKEHMGDIHALIPLVMHYHEILFHKQSALKEDYRGRLRAEYDSKGEPLDSETVRLYKPFEVREPEGRRTIDTRENVDATWFQRILIGSMYLAHADNTQEIDEAVRDFVEEALTTDENYLKTAKQAYFNYMSGLCDYGLPQPLKTYLKDTFGIDPLLYGKAEASPGLNPFAFLSRTEPANTTTQSTAPAEKKDSSCSIM